MFYSASYHTVKTSDCPNNNWYVQDMREWLEKEGTYCKFEFMNIKLSIYVNLICIYDRCPV